MLRQPIHGSTNTSRPVPSAEVLKILQEIHQNRINLFFMSHIWNASHIWLVATNHHEEDEQFFLFCSEQIHRFEPIECAPSVVHRALCIQCGIQRFLVFKRKLCTVKIVVAAYLITALEQINLIPKNSKNIFWALVVRDKQRAYDLCTQNEICSVRNNPHTHSHKATHPKCMSCSCVCWCWCWCEWPPAHCIVTLQQRN